jgi:hypothetical protein
MGMRKSVSGLYREIEDAQIHFDSVCNAMDVPC